MLIIQFGGNLTLEFKKLQFIILLTGAESCIFIAPVWEAICSGVGGNFILLDKCLIDQAFGVHKIIPKWI